jgi:Crp-like helix-turn-helix domain
MRSAVCRADTIEGDAICRRCRRPTGFDVRGLNERRPAGDFGGELPRARRIAAVLALDNAKKPRRLGSDNIELTQEFLSHMLGVRRTSVSLCAHSLQKSGLIRYSRGKIKIVSRKGLEECACECYAAIRECIDKAIPPK